jgi:hypothetical protein
MAGLVEYRKNFPLGGFTLQVLVMRGMYDDYPFTIEGLSGIFGCVAFLAEESTNASHTIGATRASYDAALGTIKISSGAALADFKVVILAFGTS